VVDDTGNACFTGVDDSGSIEIIEKLDEYSKKIEILSRHVY
jgi:hypothetical protein